MLIKETELAEVCSQLPPIQPYEPQQDSCSDQVFICACGFEDRSLAIPSGLCKPSRYQTRHSLVLDHETNEEDNASNRPALTHYLSSISQKGIESLRYRDDDFVVKFDNIMDQATVSGERIPRVSFDITACSSQMVLSTLKLLFHRKVSLRLLYTEADTYHPTLLEYQQSPHDWTVDGKGMSRGILRVREFRLYPGLNLRELPMLLVAFPTFKPERINSIRTELQPAKTVWIIGIPHATENEWRVKAMREINGVTEADTAYEITTFGYIETFAQLEQIYKGYEESFHVIVAPHGSKLQNVGIALFCLLREDVGLWFSTPLSFNTAQYTSGIKAFWQINFGSVQTVSEIVRACGKLELKLS